MREVPCPMIEKTVRHMGEVTLHKCRYLGSVVGFDCSAREDQCEMCLSYDDYDNPLIRKLKKIFLLGRVRCGEDAQYHHQKAMSVAVATKRLLAETDAPWHIVVDALKEAVRRGMDPNGAADAAEKAGIKE